MNLTLAIIFTIAVLVIWNFFNQRQYIFDRRKSANHPRLEFYDPEDEHELNEMEAFSSRGYSVIRMADRRKRER